MQDNSAYQMILDEGELRGDRRNILRLGRVRFGQPSSEVEANISSINDIERLGRMVEAVLKGVEFGKS